MSNYSEITLISDEAYSLLHSPNNSPGNFRTYFDHPLTFENGEVALKKITFPNFFQNINESNNAVFISKYPSFTFINEVRMYTEETSQISLQKFYIPQGKYKSIEALLNALNEQGERDIEWWKELASISEDRKLLRTTSDGVNFKYNLPQKVKLYLHRDILTQLGYTNLANSGAKYRSLQQEGVPSTHVILPDEYAFNGSANLPPDFERTSPILNVYSDMIRPTRVYGHQMLPLLLQLNTSNLKGDIVEYSPTHLSYFPLRQNTISMVEISIYSAKNEIVSFSHGSVIIELVVRDYQTTHNQL